MSVLPIPGDMFFDDFSMCLTPCVVSRLGENVRKYTCLPDEDENYVHIKCSDNPDIVVGDIITFDDESHTVTKIVYETYDGKKDLMKVCY